MLWQEALAALEALPADLISRINAASVAADDDEDTVNYDDIAPLPQVLWMHVFAS